MRNLQIPLPFLQYRLLFGLLFLALPARAVDMEAAHQQFLSSCGVCHIAEKNGGTRQGPNLYGVYGRKVGSVAGFEYSDALKGGNWRWDETTLDPWLTNAQAAHPHTFMNYRQSNPEKRLLVIEYLKSLSEEGEKSK